MKKYNRKKTGSTTENANQPDNTSDDDEGSSAGDNKTITIILGVIAVLLLIQTIQVFLGGDERAPRPEVAPQQQAQQQQQQQMEQPEMDFQQQQPTGPTTEVTYSTMNQDFGQVNIGETYSHTFELVNTGNEELHYTNVYGDPGVNVLNWPNQPIPPGGSGEIEIEFSPDESGPINKVVHIDGNTQPSHVHLNITAQGN